MNARTAENKNGRLGEASVEKRLQNQRLLN